MKHGQEQQLWGTGQGAAKGVGGMGMGSLYLSLHSHYQNKSEQRFLSSFFVFFFPFCFVCHFTDCEEQIHHTESIYKPNCD